MKSGLPRIRRLTLIQQLLALRKDFPEGVGHVRHGRLNWLTVLHPTPLSRGYAAQVDYRQGDVPRIFVIEPSLAKLAGNRPIPHLYQQDPAYLCLYRAIYGEWSDDKLISRTLLRWAASWLFYFEDWLISGEWRGGGEHPPLRPMRHGGRAKRWRPPPYRRSRSA